MASPQTHTNTHTHTSNKRNTATFRAIGEAGLLSLEEMREPNPSDSVSLPACVKPNGRPTLREQRWSVIGQRKHKENEIYQC